MAAPRYTVIGSAGPRGGPRRRRGAARALALLLALTAASARGEEGAALPATDPEVTPYAGRLPRSGDPPTYGATIVVEAATGRPVRGALVRAHLEVIAAEAPSVAPLIGAARTDEFGVAAVPLDASTDVDRHWVVTAPGFAPVYEYGFLPPERIALEPAVPNAVRLLDTRGRPLGGVPVEAYLGCPHAPAIASGVTDAEGFWRVAEGTAGGANLWARASGTARTCGGLSPAWGEEAEVEVLPPGFVVRGRVRDALGTPIYGATVRGDGFPRGPVTRTDREGNFLLPGVAPDEGLDVVHPTIESALGNHHVERAVPDVPLDLRWVPGGFVEPTARARLLVTLPAGLGLLRIGPDGRAERERVPEEGTLDLELPVGTHRLRSLSPFDPMGLEELVVTLAEGETRRVEPPVRPRARLRLEGEVPDAWGATLTSGGRTLDLEREKGARTFQVAHLPLDGEAVVLVGRWAFPVGPACRGERVVTVSLPRPHRVRLRGAEGLEEVGLSGPDTEELQRLERLAEGTLELWHGGRFRLYVEGADRDAPTRIVPLTLPPIGRGGIDRVVDVPREALPAVVGGEAVVHLRRADGQPVGDLALSGRRWWGEGSSPIETSAPGTVTVRGKGLQPFLLRVTKPGEQEHVIPAGSVEVLVRDADGEPAGERALLDGWLHDVDDEGRLDVGGLAAGPHVLVVDARRGEGGVVWRFQLAEGERRTKTLVLP